MMYYFLMLPVFVLLAIAVAPLLAVTMLAIWISLAIEGVERWLSKR